MPLLQPYLKQRTNLSHQKVVRYGVCILRVWWFLTLVSASVTLAGARSNLSRSALCTQVGPQWPLSRIRSLQRVEIYQLLLAMLSEWNLHVQMSFISCYQLLGVQRWRDTSASVPCFCSFLEEPDWLLCEEELDGLFLVPSKRVLLMSMIFVAA